MLSCGVLRRLQPGASAAVCAAVAARGVGARHPDESLSRLMSSVVSGGSPRNRPHFSRLVPRFPFRLLHRNRGGTKTKSGNGAMSAIATAARTTTPLRRKPVERRARPPPHGGRRGPRPPVRDQLRTRRGAATPLAESPRARYQDDVDRLLRLESLTSGEWGPGDGCATPPPPPPPQHASLHVPSLAEAPAHATQTAPKARPSALVRRQPAARGATAAAPGW